MQHISGAREGEGTVKELTLPDRIWGNVRRDKVQDTYKDIFRENDFMSRGFINDILEDQHGKPDFRDGALIQQIIDAAILSH